MITPEECKKYYQFEDKKRLDLFTSFTRNNEEDIPLKYLDFAKNDLGLGDNENNCINAISNARRAMHSHLDMLLALYGFEGMSGNFPKRINIIEQIGLVSGRTLKNLNKLRNVVEHEYHTPEYSDAELFVDVVELFIQATQSIVIEAKYTKLIELNETFTCPTCKGSLLTIYLFGFLGQVLIISEEFVKDLNDFRSEFFLNLKTKEKELLKKNSVKNLNDKEKKNLFSDVYNPLIIKNRVTYKKIIKKIDERDSYLKWLELINC